MILTETEVYELSVALRNDILADKSKDVIARWNSLSKETQKQVVDLCSDITRWPPKDKL